MVEELDPDIARIVAPNPSPMTHRGTNTYLVGRDDLAVIDPGPDDDAHLAAIARAVEGRPVTAILVTHAHLDHSAGVRRLSAALKAPVCGFGRPEAGRSAVMTRLAAEGLTGGGEGVDAGFRPDRLLRDGDLLAVGRKQLQVLWTPGHFAGHLCFAWEDVLFTGDHVMGWASSLISPPDGDLTRFMHSCERLSARDDRIFYPGHGDPVPDPPARLAWLVEHRRAREAQILATLGTAPAGIAELTRRVYADVPAELRAAAERNTFAQLVDLHLRGTVVAAPRLGFAARFRLP